MVSSISVSIWPSALFYVGGPLFPVSAAWFVESFVCSVACLPRLPRHLAPVDTEAVGALQATTACGDCCQRFIHFFR